MPDAQDLEAAYGRWYRPPGGRFSAVGDRLFRRLRGHLAVRLDRIAPPGPILDVGAGDGVLIDALQARGRTVSGIDRRTDHPAIRETQLTDDHGSYAGIVFWHSLEHIWPAGAALDHATSILEPDGLLVIAMPNVGSVQAEVFGDRWFALDLPRHLVHVPAQALLARLTSLGLAIERVGYLRGGQAVFGWLHGFVGYLPGRPDLYDAIRRPEARQRPISGISRTGALLAATALLPVAATCALTEAAIGRGGSVYVEARRV